MAWVGGAHRSVMPLFRLSPSLRPTKQDLEHEFPTGRPAVEATSPYIHRGREFDDVHLLYRDRGL